MGEHANMCGVAGLCVTCLCMDGNARVMLHEGLDRAVRGIAPHGGTVVGYLLIVVGVIVAEMMNQFSTTNVEGADSATPLIAHAPSHSFPVARGDAVVVVPVAAIPLPALHLSAYHLVCGIAMCRLGRVHCNVEPCRPRRWRSGDAVRGDVMLRTCVATAGLVRAQRISTHRHSTDITRL